MSCICKPCFTILRQFGRFFGRLCGCVKPEQDEEQLIVPEPGENGNDSGSSSSSSSSTTSRGSQDGTAVQRAAALPAGALADLLAMPLGTPPEILQEIPKVVRQQDPPANPQEDQLSDPPEAPRAVPLAEWLAQFRGEHSGSATNPQVDPQADQQSDQPADQQSDPPANLQVDPPADLPAPEEVILTMSGTNISGYHLSYMNQVEDVLQVDVLKPLGHGSFGMVFKCKSKEDENELWAVKGLISKHILPVAERLAWEQDVMREVTALDVLRHESIVESYGHIYVQHQVHHVNCYAAIKTELLDCTLGEILTIRELVPEQVALLIYSLGDALSWMVTQRYAHHDIKPDNIMFKNLDKNAQEFESAFLQAIPKITDFGFARVYPNVARDDAREEEFGAGTEMFAAPEKIAFCKRKAENVPAWYRPFKSDACSFGLTLAMCLVVKIDKNIRLAFESLKWYRKYHPEVANSPYLTAIERLIQPVVDNRWHVSDVVASLE